MVGAYFALANRTKPSVIGFFIRIIFTLLMLTQHAANGSELSLRFAAITSMRSALLPTSEIVIKYFIEPTIRMGLRMATGSKLQLVVQCDPKRYVRLPARPFMCDVAQTLRHRPGSTGSD